MVHLSHCSQKSSNPMSNAEFPYRFEFRRVGMNLLNPVTNDWPCHIGCKSDGNINRVEAFRF